METKSLYHFKSHIDGKNADVNIFVDRTEARRHWFRKPFEHPLLSHKVVDEDDLGDWQDHPFNCFAERNNFVDDVSGVECAR